MIPRVGLTRTDEFRKDAVRIALTSGLTRKQVADDLGVRYPAGHCSAMSREGDVDAEQMDYGTSMARQCVFTCTRGEEHRSAFSIGRMCHVINVSARGLRAFRSRPASRRQRSDLVAVAHIKEQSRLSLGSYGRPRMTEELKGIGLNLGHRRMGRFLLGDVKPPARQRMRENKISVIRTCKHKATTDSSHKFNIAPNLLDRNFAAALVHVNMH